MRDVYAITVDGKNLRRVTNPPVPAALAAYPQGRVHFTSNPGEAESAEYALYVQGMRAAERWRDDGIYQTWRVPTYVADFGDRKQRAVLRNITHPASTTWRWRAVMWTPAVAAGCCAVTISRPGRSRRS